MAAAAGSMDDERAATIDDTVEGICKLIEIIYSDGVDDGAASGAGDEWKGVVPRKMAFNIINIAKLMVELWKDKDSWGDDSQQKYKLVMKSLLTPALPCNANLQLIQIHYSASMFNVYTLLNSLKIDNTTIQSVGMVPDIKSIEEPIGTQGGMMEAGKSGFGGAAVPGAFDQY